MTLKEIQATEEIMRLAINGQKNVDSLIGYYRDQIDKFNEERALWIKYYESCKDNVANRHLIEREITSSQSRKSDLQSDIAGIKGSLTYQRQKYFHKIEQNDKIKQRLEQSKKRLRQLTAQVKPINLQTSQYKSNTKTRANDNDSIYQKETGNTKTTELQLQLINISKQHEKKKAQLQQIIDYLKNQLEELVSQHSNRGQQCSKQYKEALTKLTDLQRKHMNLTQQFFRFRMDNMQEEQRIQQENQIVRLKNMALAQKLKILKQNHANQFKTVDNQVKRKNKQFKQKYDQQLRRKQEHLSILKEQHQRISDIYLNKMKKLQQELRQTTEKSKTLQQKTKVQVSSLKSQIKILNNRLQNTAMTNMRSQLINNQESQDDSSVTLEMEQLEKINQQVKNLQKKIEGTK